MRMIRFLVEVLIGCAFAVVFVVEKINPFAAVFVLICMIVTMENMAGIYSKMRRGRGKGGR